VGNAGPLVVNLPPGATLLELQDRLHIPRGEVALFWLTASCDVKPMC